MENCGCTYVKCGKFIITIAMHMIQIMEEFCRPEIVSALYYLFDTFIEKNAERE